MSERRYECDVVVIGAGPAGIAAGTMSAEAGARTIVVDEGFAPGGQIWRSSTARRMRRRARTWLSRLDRSHATVLASTSVVDARVAGDEFTLLCESPVSALQIVARNVIIATGARERFLPFPGWTLPNVMGIGGAQALLKAGTSFRGKRVVISGSGPLMLPVASSLAKAGADLLLVAEQAPLSSVARYTATLWRKPLTLLQAAALRTGFIRSRYATGQWVKAASGDEMVREAIVTDGHSSRGIACDILCTGFGLVPNTEIARLIGCDVRGRVVVVDYKQETTVPRVFAAGEPTGIAGVDASLVEGEIAGGAAAGRAPDRRLIDHRVSLVRDALAMERAFALRPELSTMATPETIVCRCEDVRLRDLERAWSPRQAKLYTRAGMGPCQGRICGAALECVMGWPNDTVRPPSQPARVSTLTYESTPSPSRAATEHGAH